jgi:hypothetical protein
LRLRCSRVPKRALAPHPWDDGVRPTEVDPRWIKLCLLVPRVNLVWTVELTDVTTGRSHCSLARVFTRRRSFRSFPRACPAPHSRFAWPHSALRMGMPCGRKLRWWIRSHAISIAICQTQSNTTARLFSQQLESVASPSRSGAGGNRGG